jgi:hypothetical protein
MVSPSLATPVEAGAPQAPAPGPAAAPAEVLLVAGLGNPAAADYADHLRRHGDGRCAVVTDADGPSAAEHGRLAGVVLFLPRRLTARRRAALDEVLALAGRRRAEFVGIVSTFRVHLGDRGAAEAEDYALGRARGLRARAVVFRPGHVLSPRSRAGRILRRLGFCRPLVPRRLHGCCVDGEELFAAIEAERRAPRPRRGRVFTLLGPNRPWRDLLAERGARGVLPACLTAACALLALLAVGQFAALALALLARRRPALRAWNVPTLRPDSLGELLALVNPYNFRRVKVVGYNNGVTHFGQRYPGRTLVSTVRCDRVRPAGPDRIKADCGATIRRARDFLAETGRELYVLPNYSYVCLGTAFFVPIHGSAADFSCVADTITKVVLYDPTTDCFLVARRDAAAFRAYAYNLKADVLLLRLYLRVKPKGCYYVRREEWDNPGSAELLDALRDGRAANAEVRKARAGGGAVQVYRYYTEPGAAPAPVLELPRDSLGRLWDRLEENPVTSFVMHALTRYFAWHVELFFTAEEFATFWDTHRALPLRKIQLRHIRQDGLPHSPFRRHDCVSADMFMLRRHRRVFEAYLRRTFAVVRSNPGKHSR